MFEWVILTFRGASFRVLCRAGCLAGWWDLIGFLDIYGCRILGTTAALVFMKKTRFETVLAITLLSCHRKTWNLEESYSFFETQLYMCSAALGLLPDDENQQIRNSEKSETKSRKSGKWAVVLPIFDTFIRPVGLEPLTENDPTGGLNLSRPIPDFSYGIKRRFRRKSQKYFFGR